VPWVTSGRSSSSPTCSRRNGPGRCSDRA
jgi:hypothetical protein